MKTILIKGAPGSGKTKLANTIGGVILDDLFHDNGVSTLVITAKSKFDENIIVCTQNEDFNERGFDLVFRLKNK